VNDTKFITGKGKAREPKGILSVTKNIRLSMRDLKNRYRFTYKEIEKMMEDRTIPYYSTLGKDVTNVKNTRNGIIYFKESEIEEWIFSDMFRFGEISKTKKTKKIKKTL